MTNQRHTSNTIGLPSENTDGLAPHENHNKPNMKMKSKNIPQDRIHEYANDNENAETKPLLTTLGSHLRHYEIYEGSQSAHCCFDYTVVDTTRPSMIGGEHYRDYGGGQYHYESICECFDLRGAEMIRDALNS